MLYFTCPSPNLAVGEIDFVNSIKIMNVDQKETSLFNKSIN